MHRFKEFVWGNPFTPPFAKLFDAFCAQCQARPYSAAVIDNDRVSTYSELLEHTMTIAAGLQALGVDCTAPVIVAQHRSTDQIAFFLACSYLGLSCAPVDPQHPAARLSSISEILGSRAMIHSAYFNTCNAPNGCAVHSMDQVRRASKTDRRIDVARGAEFIFFTSGSTGEPKGVRLSEPAILNALYWRQKQFSVSSCDRVLYKQNVMVDTSLWEVFLPLITGATVIVARPLGQVDFEYLTDLVISQDVSVIQFVGSLLRHAIEHGGVFAHGSLRALLCGGESWSSDIVQRLKRDHPHLTVFNVYGQTETGLGILSADVTRIAPGDQMWLEDVAFNIGVALDGDELEGELLVAGSQLLLGYFGNPSELVQVETPTGVLPAFRTGDHFTRTAAGGWQFLGRRDNQFKMNGLRFNLEEVEQVASKITNTAAVAQVVTDCGEKLVCLHVVTPTTSMTAEELRMKLRTYLPAGVLPKEIRFTASLPTTEHGKVDRRRFLEN